MERTLDFWVMGGDLRQVALARLLHEDGHRVHTYGLEDAPEAPAAPEKDLRDARLADCVVLPLPAAGEGMALHAPYGLTKTPLTQVFDALQPGQLVCAGKPDGVLRLLAREKGLRMVDYFGREELAVANAVPTAEGTIHLAMELLPVTLHGARVLVIGYGRLGKALAPRLVGLGAAVSVSARKWEDLAWIRSCGCTAEQTGQLDGLLGSYDLVINTVPAPVLGADRLERLSPQCAVIDLATLPGGVDWQAARKLGVRAVHAPGLPGKCAPETAGRAVRDTVYHILLEQGM